MTRSIALLTALAPILHGPGPIPARKYSIDRSHSSIEFAVRFMGLSKVKGRFARFSGTILYDAERPERSTVAVVVDPASIDTDNDTRDRHLRSPDWFDVETYPRITFQSTAIERTADGFVARGPLTMHGVTRQVAIPLRQLHGDATDAWGNHRVGFEGELTVDRKDYGIEGTSFFNKAFDAARMGVADEVTLELEISGRIFNMERIDFSRREGTRPAGEPVMEAIEKDGVEAGLAAWRALRDSASDRWDLGESQLNTVGYKLLQRGDAEGAIEVFRTNLAEHPESVNAHDSLAEAYARAGRTDEAMVEYRTVVAADPWATDAVEMLRWLEGRTGEATLGA